MAQVTVTALAYLVLDSPELDAWERFGSEVLGMESVRGRSELRLRMDERAHRIVLRQATADALAAIGWDVANTAELERARTVLEDAGCDVGEGTADELEARAVEAMIWTRDPDGNRVEVVAAAQPGPSPISGGTPMKEFVTGDLGLGHVVLMTKDQTAMQAFYEGVLGFRVTDVFSDFMVFLRCNGRHHSVGLINAGASGLNHVMIEVPSIDDVGTALDALRERGDALAADLGRHSNDEVVSFYAWSPGGFMVEYGTGGRLIEPNAQPGEADVDVWGHQGLIEAHMTMIERAHAAQTGPAAHRRG
jgi:2,3-dihydroxybiphenyl 1,2-dioxygenase